MTLNSLIKSLKLDWVNSDITEKNFPEQEVEKDFKKYKLFKFDRNISSEDAISKMKEDGYRPANVYELLTWAKKGWNKNDLVIALGSVWRGCGGDRRVACLLEGGDGRELDLGCYDGGWSGGCRFLAVRESKKLGHSLEDRIKSLEDDMNKIKKILII